MREIGERSMEKQREFNGESILLFVCLGIIFVAIFVLLVWWLRPTTSSICLAENSPEWIEETINTAEDIVDVEAAPQAWLSEDGYLMYDFRFYDAETDEQIIDYEILEELLAMFQYTQEPFVYDRSRSVDGNCLIYYNGVVPAGYAPAIFSGFQGKENFPESSAKKIKEIYLVYDIHSSEAVAKYDLEKQLDEMQKSKLIH